MKTAMLSLPGNGTAPMPVAPVRADRPEVRIIPYDHVSEFALTGQPGNVIPDVINVGVEGVFVAVAIGYGVSSSRADAIELAGSGSYPVDGGSGSDPVDGVTLAQFPPHALVQGVRLNPKLDAVVFPRGKSAPDFSLTIDEANKRGLFETIPPAPDDISFLFNIVDTGTGRELQNAPIHSIAGLGKANGERPFRMLAKPLAFLPRSSVRVEVEEQTSGAVGTLQIVLHGYKILGAAGVPYGQLRGLYQTVLDRMNLREAATGTVRRVEAGLLPSNRVVPFDYVGRLDLVGRPGREVETEIYVNVEGEFVATSIGYGLRVAGTTIDLPSDLVPPDDTGSIDVGKLDVTRFPPDVLKVGFRIRRNLLRLAFTNGQLSTVRHDTVRALFEPLNLPERVQFLYGIEDTGTGRAWQDQLVHSVAGLGIANGDRPFRPWAWPMSFLPRSTIRLRVREIFGRGQLFIVFHGYKILREP
jgi:hypothetical protein